MIKEAISRELKEALEGNDKRRACTLRLIKTAIKDREAAAREAGKDGLTDTDVFDILHKMIDQRIISTKAYEETGKLDFADQEQQEIAIIQSFLPHQLNENEMNHACEDVVSDLGARGLKDIGRTMSALKERYPGQMDFGRANKVVRKILERPAAMNGVESNSAPQ